MLLILLSFAVLEVAKQEVFRYRPPLDLFLLDESLMDPAKSSINLLSHLSTWPLE